MEVKYFKASADFDFDQCQQRLKLLKGSEGILIEKVNEHVLIACEKYFIRTNSVAACTLLFTKTDSQYEVVVISSGAGGGLMNLSYGVTTKYLNEVSQILIELGAIIARKKDINDETII